VRFQVLMVVSMQMAVFWVVAPCSLVEVYRRFRPACTHKKCAVRAAYQYMDINCVRMHRPVRATSNRFFCNAAKKSHSPMERLALVTYLISC
jgi:hypothetical protein